MIQQAVKHQTQRIDVCTGTIGLIIEYLRGHIAVSTYLSSPGDPLCGFGNAEISQLIAAGGGDEDVLGFDVSVKNAVLSPMNFTVPEPKPWFLIKVPTAWTTPL